LINKEPEKAVALRVDLGAFRATGGSLFRYSSANATAVVHETVAPDGNGVGASLPPYSITLLDLAP
jgi:hypothetical protein